VKKISKLSLGMGDRFAREGRAQLHAIVRAKARGIDLTPVWNKSNREHTIIGSRPDDVRHEAEAAVSALGWKDAYHIDADHINLANVERFIDASDFYTIDVADFTGTLAGEPALAEFDAAGRKYLGKLSIPGLDHPLAIDAAAINNTARKFLRAMQEAAQIHRHIVASKDGNFIAEVSIDETDQPQTPAELFLILLMLAGQNVPCQTIAPKFTGRFNKGVDYVGDLVRFEKEFDENLCVVRFAISEFGLPETLKLSVHSGSDKFSLYPIINRLLKKHDAGVHLKTAGTTWLEEVIGLAESGGESLDIARDIYTQAHGRFAELAKPYATVVDIDPAKLPTPADVLSWSSDQYCAALRHEPSSPHYNLHFRQLLHVSFKIAAEMGDRYLDALQASEETIARNVTHNLYHRHILPLFG
jgi:tagaturonate epimerase